MRPLRIQIWAGRMGGHWQAAESLAQALRELDPEACVEAFDIYGRELAGRLGSALANSYDALVSRLPWLWGALFYATSSRLALGLLRRVAALLARRRPLQALVAQRPDLVVRVISDLGQLAALTASGAALPPLAVVITDPVTFHPAWLTGHERLCVVATEEARRRCLRYSVPPGAVQALGFPIRAHRFCPPPEPAPRPTSRPLSILMMVGACGAGRLYEDLAALLEPPLGLAITVVCGRNRRLYRRIRALVAGRAGAAPTVLAYTEEIPRLMREADLLITKAGPTTIYEAIASRLPMILTSHLPGQERGNAPHFVALGVALRSRGPAETRRLVEELAADRGRLEQMRRAAAAEGAYGASMAIARGLLEAAEKARGAHGRGGPPTP